MTRPGFAPAPSVTGVLSTCTVGFFRGGGGAAFFASFAVAAKAGVNAMDKATTSENKSGLAVIVGERQNGVEEVPRCNDLHNLGVRQRRNLWERRYAAILPLPHGHRGLKPLDPKQTRHALVAIDPLDSLPEQRGDAEHG